MSLARRAGQLVSKSTGPLNFQLANYSFQVEVVLDTEVSTLQDKYMYSTNFDDFRHCSYYISQQLSNTTFSWLNYLHHTCTFTLRISSTISNKHLFFFSEKFSWPGGPRAPNFNWPKTKIYWPGPVGPLVKKKPVPGVFPWGFSCFCPTY